MLVNKRWFWFLGLAGFLTAALVTARAANAAPLAADSLRISATMEGGRGSLYNPRSAGGYNYVVDITNPYTLARYPVGSDEPDIGPLTIATGTENRMTMPFEGANSTTYVLSAGGSNESGFTLRNYDDLSPISTVQSSYGEVEPNSFDWVDDDTIIFSSYENRSTLYMAHVAVNGSVLSVTQSGLGAISTSAARIRNVIVGDEYDGYAYFSEVGVNPAGVYALNLATGAQTLLTTYTESQSRYTSGVWTVKEVDGYLYLHTPGDGITVYNMTGATTLGDVAETYSQAVLDALTGNSSASYGFDVVDGGARMLYGNGGDKVIEIVDIAIPGDANGDGAVNSGDLDIVRAHWGQSVGSIAEGDLSGDGMVNSADLDIVRANWGTTASAAVPEPAVCGLFIAGLALASIHRRRR